MGFLPTSLGGAITDVLGLGSLFGKKPGPNPQQVAAGNYYQGLANRGATAGQNITNLLPTIFSNAGLNYTPGQAGGAGAFSQKPFSSVFTDPRYQAFRATSIQPLESQRAQQLSQFNATKGLGTTQRGFGQNLINQNFAAGEAQANRGYGLAQQQRQDQFLNAGLGALSGQADAGAQGAVGLTNLGQYAQGRSDIQNAGQFGAGGSLLSSVLYQQHLAGLHAAAGSTGNGQISPLLAQIESGQLDISDPATLASVQQQLGLTDPGSGGYGTVTNPYGSPGVYGQGG